ncbi:hypothetical protein [Clostridium sp. OS1-26]|uniref:hypothetical protein n=1 Tax=Clostridium sp. OS1-26 TaxID=3070681 RepID=UPI0027E0374F|nr:hypothetical protein [Clostridium sp. OS1-26]WML36639.1 hypothetical protein RCG18_08435 [Clostridium sp. OS1-26]
MTSKKLIQNIALAITITTAGSIFLPNLVSAKSLDNPKQVKIETTSITDVIKNNQSLDSKISQDLINKATPFIKTTQSQFYLSEEGYSYLNLTERKIVLDYINNSNMALKDASKTGNLNKKGNTFEQSINEPNSSSNTRAIAVRSMSAQYANVTYTWWGAQIYFSHQAVSDLNDFFTISGITTGAAAASGIGEFLAKQGIKISGKFLGPISLYGTGVAWAMSKVDNGNGVYLDCILYVPCKITAA